MEEKETAEKAEMKCCMSFCDEVGTLELENGSWICENCAQIQGELAP